MHRVDVAVTHVDPDGLKGKAELLPWCVDDDGRPQAAGAERQVPAGRGVTRWGVGGQWAWRDGTGLEAAGRVICNKQDRLCWFFSWFFSIHPSDHINLTCSHTAHKLSSAGFWGGDDMTLCTCGDDEGQGWDGCWLGNLPSAGKPLPVRCLQLVTKASRAGRVLGRWVLGPGAVAANPDPPQVWHNHLSCR